MTGFAVLYLPLQSRHYMELANSKVIPIRILTGFLGAEKTTLLNRIQDDVISLANGCVCCTLRDDLVTTVIETINRPEAPRLDFARSQRRRRCLGHRHDLH